MGRRAHRPWWGQFHMAAGVIWPELRSGGPSHASARVDYGPGCLPGPLPVPQPRPNIWDREQFSNPGSSKWRVKKSEKVSQRLRLAPLPLMLGRRLGTHSVEFRVDLAEPSGERCQPGAQICGCVVCWVCSQSLDLSTSPDGSLSSVHFCRVLATSCCP